ncbi:MAG TPA: hypothetical protein VGN95_23140 [Pyrinomonadaceae bacterium]|nr:hypothetical protein [Pyrinomonadaceae bacterium]
MMGNSDPLLTSLKSFGYCIVRLPKADIKPLQILVKQGNNLERLGELGTLLVAGSNITVPEINQNIAASNIIGAQTGDLKIGVGLSLLGNIIGAMGGSKLGLDVKYQQAKSAAFEFQEVLEDKVEIARLDQYLADADVSPFSRYVATLLEADEIYITTAIIKSRVFVLEAKKSDGIELELSVADLQQLVGTNVEVGTHNSIASKVTYKGAIPLVFGFQAVRVYYDDGRYTAFKPMNAGMAAMRSPGSGSGAGADWLVTESPFVRLVTD